MTTPVRIQVIARNRRKVLVGVGTRSTVGASGPSGSNTAGQPIGLLLALTKAA